MQCFFGLASTNNCAMKLMRWLHITLLSVAISGVSGCQSNTTAIGAPGNGEVIADRSDEWFTGASSAQMQSPCGGRMVGTSMLRFRYAMMNGLPDEYRGLKNPLVPSKAVISEGDTLYRTYCASCHGATGQGDGPAATGLWPPPSNLSWTVRKPRVSDGYLMWAVAEGGASLGTAMPSYGGVLEETDRWKLIQYLRTL